MIRIHKKEKGKGVKIVIVNLKMCNYNSGKLKGAKLYTVNQNGAKLGKCAKIVIVNLKMCNYNSSKLKGAKMYNVNQNGAKLVKCAKITIVNLNVRFPDVAPPSVNDVSYI